MDAHGCLIIPQVANIQALSLLAIIMTTVMELVILFSQFAIVNSAMLQKLFVKLLQVKNAKNVMTIVCTMRIYTLMEYLNWEHHGTMTLK